jgi:drug/metabolite transporter (DMT)-like permease
LWGLVFLAPALVSDFTPLQLTAGRYLFYGLIAAMLVAPRWADLRARIGRREGLALAWLSLAGNIVYYILLSSAVQLGGIAMTSLIIGFLPVTVTIIGSRDKGAVPLRKLMASLLLCAASTVCISWQALAMPATGSVAAQVAGFFCAVGALISWTAYAVGNSRWLARLDHVSAHDWNLLVGVVTGAESLALIPLALVMGIGAHPAFAWMQFAGVSLGVAVLASILGNGLWNRMNRLLPLTLAGQMILFETLFALIYGFLWDRRLPTLLEVVAFVLMTASVLACIAAHRRHPTAAETLRQEFS